MIFMPEQSAESKDTLDQLNDYFRDPSSNLAKMLDELCPLRGQAYLHSPQKRILDLLVSTPALLFAIPGTAIFSALNSSEGIANSFYFQERLKPTPDCSEQEMFTIWKFRTMAINAANRNKEVFNVDFDHANDERVDTELAKFMRHYKIDELPQVLQVFLGEMSLVGLRAITPFIVDGLDEFWSKERKERWMQAYNAQERAGVTGLYPALNKDSKWDIGRYHYDMFYANNASLRLDLYTIWLTMLRITHQEGL
jgi:lipopolysaccharide/colanic/teichoic acid biosynthesis glycosyltransferase